MGGTQAAGSAPRLGFVAVVLAGSVALSRVLGFAREAVLSRVLGAGAEADAYRAAFMLPDLLNYFLAGGALSIAFIPFYAQLRDREGSAAADDFLALIFGTTSALAVVVTIALWIGADGLVVLQFPHFSSEQIALTARLTRILLPAQIFFIAGGVLRGALMARGRFASQSVAPLVYNVAIIAGGITIGTRIGAEGFAWGALIGAVFGAFGTAWWEIRSVPDIRLSMRFALRDPSLRRYLVSAFPLMLGVTLLTVDEWYYRWFGALLEAGSVAALAYARQLMQLPVAIVGQAIATAALPTLARLAAERREAELDETLLAALRAGLALSCFGAAALFAFADPLVRVVYEGGRFSAADSARVAPMLRILAFAVPGWIAQQIAVRGFYARGDTWRPMWLGTAIAVAAAGLYAVLGRVDGAIGLAVAGSVAMSANAIATLVYLRAWSRGPALGAMAQTTARAAAAAACAALAVIALPRLGEGRAADLAWLALGGTFFAAVAVGAAWIFGDPFLRNSLRAAARRIRRLR